jgi:RNase P subunit RPR2
MTTYTPRWHPKQHEALKVLSTNNDVTRVLYGGAAGGGKSHLGIHWQILRRITFPQTIGFIGRNTLKDIRQYTIPEVMKALELYGLRQGKGYVYNGQDMFFEFFNGSKIYTVDLCSYPTDMEFQRFGSSQFTDGFIEEAAEISEKAASIIFSRIRYRLNEFCRHCKQQGLNKGEITDRDESGRPIRWTCPSCGQNSGGIVPKLLLTCNPNTGFLRSQFYQPYMDGRLPPDLMFIPSTVDDNPSVSIEYVKALESLPEMDRKRLRYGDWDYSDASDTMFQYADIQAMFVDRLGEGEYFITADIARLGKDRTTIGVWHGLALVKIIELRQARVNEVADVIRKEAQEYGVKLRNIIADEDGVGGGVVDLIRCTGFNNGASAQNKNYINAKSECFFKLAEYIEQGRISIRVPEKREVITKELQAVRRKKPDGDTRLAVISKDEMKGYLNGNSPDYADMLMMRMFTEVDRPKGVSSVRVINVNR